MHRFVKVVLVVETLSADDGGLYRCVEKVFDFGFCGAVDNGRDDGFQIGRESGLRPSTAGPIYELAILEGDGQIPRQPPPLSRCGQRFFLKRSHDPSRSCSTATSICSIRSPNSSGE
jgi:hypothetical protein